MHLALDYGVVAMKDLREFSGAVAAGIASLKMLYSLAWT